MRALPDKRIKRGTCPRCGYYVILTRAGLIKAHNARVPLRGPFLSCSGRGAEPV
jgi:hypothetical protein